MFQITDIVALLLITTLINFFVMYISWRRRNTGSGLYFALGMMGVSFWTLMGVLDYAAVPIDLKVLFATLEYVGYNTAFYFFIIFVLSFTGYDGWLKNTSARIFLGCIPLSNIILAATNDWHGWLWSGFVRGGLGENTVIFEHGPGFWWPVITGYIMILIIIVPLWYASRSGPEISRKQSRFLFFASLVPVIGNLIYLFQPPEFKGMDWTSILFSLSSVLFLTALYSTNLFDIVPIARDEVVAGLRDGIIVIDRQGRIVDINSAAVSIIRPSVENLIGKKLGDVLQFSQSLTENVFEQEMRIEFEISSTEKQSQYYDVLVSPLRDRRKEIVGRLIVFREITSRKENELRLLQLTQAVEQSPTSVVITDLTGSIEYVNPQFSRLTGYSLVEAIGKNPNILKSGHTPPEVYQEMWQSITAGKVWEGEFLNKKKNGDMYWERAVMAPVLDEDGDILNFIAVKEDITERKLAEDALRRANQQLEIQLTEIEKLQTSLREQALRDPLTKIHNRRFLNETIEQEFHHANRASEDLSIILLDIDFFKEINDTYGHTAGDACLISLAELLQQHVRRSDTFCRYGGEEFILVLPSTNLDGAMQYAEKLRGLIAGQIFDVAAHKIRITISLGVSSYPVHGSNYKEIINKADDALYASKRGGRNRVTKWSQNGKAK